MQAMAILHVLAAITHDLAATLHDLAACPHNLAAFPRNLAAILHDHPSGVQRQQRVQNHTLTDPQALADSIHGMAIGVRGKDRKVMLTGPLLPHMLWGPERHTPAQMQLPLAHMSRSATTGTTD